MLNFPVKPPFQINTQGLTMGCQSTLLFYIMFESCRIKLWSNIIQEYKCQTAGLNVELGA